MAPTDQEDTRVPDKGPDKSGIQEGLWAAWKWVIFGPDFML